MNEVNDGCIMVGHVDIKGHDAIKRVYSSDGIAPALTTMGGGHREPKVAILNDFETEGERKLTRSIEFKYEGKPFNYVSLFSGIGGFETALNRLGGNCVLASEIDKFANQSYEALYGEPTAGDITAIKAEDVPDHDVLVGGFPCQSFSVAGKRGGFDDARGTLFFEVARLAKEKQPKVVLLENVKGLVGHDGGKTLDIIVQTLNDIGYTVDFNVLNSKYFGVPQNRERIFIVALRDDLVEPSDWIIEGTNVVAKGKRRIAAYDGTKTFNFDWPEQTEVTTRLRDVLESTVDERYYLSDERTTKLVTQLKDRDNIGEVLAVKGDLIDRENPRGQYGFDLEKMFTVRCAQVHAVAEPRMVGGHCVPKFAEEVRPTLTPFREEKRQNGPRFKESDEPAHTINTQDRHGVAIGTPPKYRIRKLTPRECWRLQGFSDDAFDTVKSAGLSDSQLYKQSGNAVTVNVIQAIGERVLTLLNGK